MRSLRSVSLRWFLVVSLVVTLSYLLAVGQGVLHTKKLWAMKAAMTARAAGVAHGRVVISNLYYAAEYLAREPGIVRLVSQARQAVANHGPDSSQARAARQAIRDETIIPWLFTSGAGNPELVRFYLNPGPVHFLAMGRGDSPPPGNARLNAIVNTARQQSSALVGFTLDGHSMGLRAVVPVWDHIPGRDKKQVVGFVELGRSLDSLLDTLSRIVKEGEGKASSAVLMPLHGMQEMAKLQGWDSLPQVQPCQHGYVVTKDSSPLIQRICQQADLKEFLSQPDQSSAIYLELNGKSYILSASLVDASGDENAPHSQFSTLGIPMLKDKIQEGGQGIMLMVIPVEPWTQSVWQFFKSKSLRLGVGLAIILVVIFLAWSLTNTQLGKLVERRTAELALANQELAQAKDRAEQASQAKGSFLASMSHEIRTPLNAVVGLADLTMGEDLDPDRNENLRAIKDSSRHLLGIINDILDFSKIEAGRVELENLDFNLQDLLRSTVQTFRKAAEEKGLYLNLDWEPSTPVYLRGDPLRLRQVLNNLLSNALKFTRKGGVVLSVLPDSGDESFSRDGFTRLLFGVKDTGEGVPPEMKNQIFESFRQADNSTSRRFGGTGLGLAICRQLVEMMGGRIQVHSSLGQGSAFIFSAVFQAGTYCEGDEAPDESTETPAAIATGTILLAEDNAMNRKVGLSMLEKYGQQVVAAQNGKDALEKLSKGHFDMVLMDVEMPVMDGIEAARRIRAGEAGQAHKNIPILALTAHALPDIQRKCLQAGMNDFLTKPLDYVSLARLIQDTLAGRSLVPAQAPSPELDRHSALERLGGSRELYQNACAMFAGDLPQRISHMQRALEEGDLGALQRDAHYVKGAAKTLGATLAGSLGESLESAARDGKVSEAKAVFAELVLVLTALVQELSVPDHG